MASRIETRRVHILINGKEVKNNIRSISKESRRLKTELSGMTRGSAEYNAKMKELKSVNKMVRTHYRELRGMGGMWGRIKTEVKQFGALAVSALGVSALANGLNNMIQRSAKFDDQISDVIKTTGLMREQVMQLSTEFKSFNTRTSRSELLQLARVAGKLGKTGVREIREWVQEADKIGVALSEDLGGNVEETVRQLSKMNELFGVEKQFGSAEALNKVGSAINAIGAASTANEGYLVEFTKRVGGVAPPAGISITQTLGLASALDQLGQTSEVSATVFAQVVPNMFKDTATYARVAQMSVSDFTQLLESDTNEALLKVLEGINGNNESYGIMVKKLQDLGLSGKRTTTVLGALAGNTSLIRKEQKLANDEFTKGTSLTEEFKQKNENLAGALARVQKRIFAAFVNTSVVNGLRDFVGWLDRVTSSGQRQSDMMEKQRTRLNVLVDALTTTNLEERERARIVKELNEEYPEYTSQVDISTASHDELRVALQKLNNEMIANIILQRKKEEIEEAETKRASIWEKRFEKRNTVLTLLNEAEEKHGVVIADNTDLATKYQMAVEQLQKQQSSSARMFDPVKQLLRKLSDAYQVSSESVSGLNTQYERAQDFVSELHEEEQKMIEQLKAEGLLRENVAGLTAEQTTLYNNLNQQLAQINQSLAALPPKSPAAVHLEQQKEALEDQISALKNAADAKKEDENATKGQNKTNAASLNTIKGINEAISELQKELEVTPGDSPRFVQLKKQIKDLRDKMAKLTGEAKTLLEELDDIKGIRIKPLTEMQEWMEFLESTGDFQDPLEGLESVKAYLNDLETIAEKTEHIKQLLATLDETAPGGTAMKAALTKLGAQLEELERAQANAIRDKYLKEEFNLKMEALDAERQATIANTILTEEEKTRILTAQEAERARIVGQYSAQQIQQIANIFGGWYEERKAKMDAHLAKLREEGASEAEIARAREGHEKKLQGFKKTSIRLTQAAEAAEASLAAIEQVRATVNMFMAAAKAGTAVPFPLNLIAIAATVGAIALAVSKIKKLVSPVDQYAGGGLTKETVVGATDGRSYTATPTRNFYGGMVTEPRILVGERGQEYVVDNWTLRQPGMMDMVGAIEQVRKSRQFFGGGFTELSSTAPKPSARPSESTPSPSARQDMAVMQDVANTLRMLKERLDQPFISVWEWDRYYEGRQKGEDSENRTKL